MKQSSTSHSNLHVWWVMLAGLIGATFIRFLDRTSRWRLRGRWARGRDWRDDHPSLFVFWHGRQLLMPAVYRRVRKLGRSKGFFALRSRHRDGQIIASVLERLGIQTIAGSSTRGGTEASLEIIEKLRAGFDVIITPDGPKGPPCVLKPGVVRIAQLSGAPIYPAAAAVRGFFKVKSWDSMVVPFPFTSGEATIGDPIYVRPEASDVELEQVRTELEHRLNSLCEEVDAACAC